MEPMQLLWTAARTLGVYALILVILRFTGKRSVGNFSPFDLLVAFMLGEIVDEAIYGDVQFAQFAVAALGIGLLHMGTGWLSFKSKKLDALLEGKPTVIIRNGELLPEGMAKERLSREEVMSLLREQMVDDVREVQLGALEVSGQLAVIKHEWAEPVQKGDVKPQERQQKEADTGGQEETPYEKQTYSPPALHQEAA